MTPYLHAFAEGAVTYVKTGRALRQAVAAVDAQDPRLRQVYWYPSEEASSRLRGIPLTVIERYAWHGGMPVYVLSFRENERDFEARIAEPFLTEDHPSAAAATFAPIPTLFIGLGGSGMEVLLRVRRRILNAKWGPGSSQRINDLSEFPVAQFLHFDLEWWGHSLDRKSDPLTDPVRFGDEDRLGGPCDLLQYFESDEALERYPLIKTWWPLTPAKLRELGISPNGPPWSNRAASRLYFFDKYETIRERIRSKLLALKSGLSNRDLFDRLGLKPGGEKLRIVVVCSVAGGTGSGSFLDMGFLAKSVASQDVGPTDSHLMLMLPTGYSGKNKQRTEANGYAALMELETCMRGDFRFVEAWRESDPRRIGARPYDDVYLVDTGNMAGQHTGDQKDVYEMVADALFEDFGSEDFATRKRTVAVKQARFKVFPFDLPVPHRYGDMKVSFYRGYSAFGQATLDTQQSVRQDIAAYRWMGGMLKAYFGVALADAMSNRATDKQRDEFLATHFHVTPMAFGDFPDFSAKGVELRLTKGEFTEFALTEDLLSDGHGNLVAGVQQKVDAALEAIQQQFSMDEWVTQVRAAIKQLQRDVMRDQDSAEAAEDRVKAQAKVLFQEITKAADAVLYGHLENREYGGLEYVISLVEHAKDRLENPNTGLVPACELNARRYAEIRDALSTCECERLLSNLVKTRGGFALFGLRQSQAEKIMGQLKTEVGNFLKFHLRGTAAEQAAQLLKDLSKWLGNREGVDASGEPVWSGFVGGLQDGRHAVLDLLARIEKTATQLRDDTKRDRATYIYIESDTPEASQSLPPAPKLAEWAKEVFDNYGGSRVLFAMLRSDEDRGKLFSGLRAQALKQLPQTAGTAEQDPLLVALEAMGPVARQRKFSELLTRAMPWVHAMLDGQFKAMADQYKCFVGVGRSKDFERFKEDLVSQIPPAAGLGRSQVELVDTGVPGRAVCYVELSGFPLTVLRGLDSWRTSYRIESPKIPVHTHRDMTRFVHPIAPSAVELERLAEDFQTFLEAASLGVLFRNPQKDVSPPGQYRFEVAPGEQVNVGNERAYRMDGLPPYYRSQIVEAVEQRVADLSSQQCAALAGLCDHYANFTYRARMVANDTGAETPRQGFASSMAALLAREFRDKAARKGASGDDLRAWMAEARRSLATWTVEVDGSDADAYPWEVQPAGEGPPRLKRVVKPDFFVAGWAFPGLQGGSPPLGHPGPGPALPGIVPGGGPAPLPPGALPPPPLVAAQYWLFSQNQKWGPYTFVQLKLTFDGGQVARDTLAWRDGLPQWAPIETLAEFAGSLAPAFQAMPPPLPPANLPPT